MNSHISQENTLFSKFRGFYCDDLLEKIDDNRDFHHSLFCEKNKFLLEILETHKLHASTFEKLNDVYECSFEYDLVMSEEERKCIIQDIKVEKNKKYICCFSKKFKEGNLKENLMWAHYANGHRGLRIDFILDSEQCKDIHKVEYSNEPIKIDIRNGLPDEDKLKIMTRKRKFWKYENEYRTITIEKKIKIKIDKIVIGRGFLPTGFDLDLDKRFNCNIVKFACAIRSVLGRDGDVKIMAYKSKYGNDLEKVC